MNKYVIGPDPYKMARGNAPEGNGPWNTTGVDLKACLKTMLANLPYPAEATGRYQGYIIPGISREEYTNAEVIQVWTDNLDYVRKFEAAVKHEKYEGNNPRQNLWPHFGKSEKTGLAMEIPVYELADFVSPSLLMLGMGEGLKDTAISPLGIAMTKLVEVRRELQMQTMRKQYEIATQREDLDSLKENMETEMEAMQAKINVLNTYLNGTKNTIWMHRGKRGSGPYSVFQNRQYLDAEIGPLANFLDFDFTAMESLEKWLVQSKNIWKFLPLERCILVTRIREQSKDYGNPWKNMQLNHFNFQNIIWIRDGENVFHVDCEMGFDNAIFPDKKEHAKLLNHVKIDIYKDHFVFKPIQERESFPFREKIKYGLVAKPWAEAKPYEVIEQTAHQFKSMDEWLNNEMFYPPELEDAIGKAALEYLTEKNRKQMTFLVLLQGLVDNTTALDIPRGTDLFQQANAEKYFKLLYDYTHVIGDPTVARNIEPYMDKAKLKKGDWIVYAYSRPERYNTEEVNLGLYQIFSIKEGMPIIKHCYPKKRQRFYSGPDDFVKIASNVEVDDVFVRLDLPLATAEAILDDRDWKMKNRWCVPLLAHWKQVLKENLTNPKNQKRIKFETPK